MNELKLSNYKTESIQICQQTVLEDIQLSIEKIWSSRNHSWPHVPFLRFYDKRPGVDNINSMISFISESVSLRLYCS